MKNELPLPRPMMPVARPKKKAMTRYSTGPFLRVALRANVQRRRRGFKRPRPWPIRNRPGKPASGADARAWRSRTRNQSTQESGSTGAANGAVSGRTSTGAGCPTARATGASRAISSSTTTSRRKGTVARPGPKPPRQAQAGGAAAAPGPSGPGSDPRPPGAYQGGFGVPQAVRLLNRAGFGPVPGPRSPRRRLGPRPPLVARPHGALRPAARRADDARLARLVRDLERRRRQRSS
jgi:hypothetical protein